MGFSQSTYSVHEDAGPVQLGLVLSNPSSTNITVQVLSTDGTATGEDNNGECLLTAINIVLQEKVLIMILDHTLSHSLLKSPVLQLVFQ